jgi:hypothetical protein
MWICPSYEGDFETPINIIHSNFKKELTKSLRDSSVFDSKHILDFDINPLKLVKDKKTFFSISFYVRQKPEKIINLNNIKNLVSSKFGYLFRDLERNLIDNEFKVSKTK